MSSLLSLARRIIAINSTAPAGTLFLARFVGGELRRLGFSVTLEKRRIGGINQANLIARIGPAGKKALLINTHLDTVVTDPRRWTKTGGNPFRAVVSGVFLYGLGTADTKAALAAQIAALEGLDLKKLRRSLCLTGTFGEETGMAGVRKLIGSRRLSRIRYALNTEPTELQPVVGNYGFRVYRVEIEGIGEKMRGEGKSHEVYFKGKAAHSAKPWLGRNAIVDCLKWIKRMEDKVTVVEMEGGLEANIVAPFCRVKVVRVPPLPCPSPSRGEGIREGVMRGDFAGVAECLLKFLSRSGKEGQTHNIGAIRFKDSRLTVKIDHRFPAGKNPDLRLKYLKE
ncbi:MAG: M20/M25/M40 family metallo-hydrolase, partial [Deltaproteobacteria bacterium]|nr:M20/M25/M40 family metallo-hydrolase [Deltaproteobacteria bacterium]